MREPLIPPLMRSNGSTHRGRKVQAPRPSLSLAGSTCTSIHEVELGQCSRFAKRPFAKGPFGKRTAFCAAAVSARQPKAQNAYSPNQPRTDAMIYRIYTRVQWFSTFFRFYHMLRVSWIRFTGTCSVPFVKKKKYSRTPHRVHVRAIFKTPRA